jgi:spore photoproduct lyase
MSNCPFDCSYCFLQNYLTNGTTTVVADVGALIDEVRQLAAASPWRLFRVGTWELADSLALEELFGNTRELIEGVSQISNILLELRTKSAVVAPILGAAHGGRTVLSFSLNPQTIISREEHKTAALSERLAAMEQAMQDGYLIALHFDPMIHYEGWREDYEDLVGQIVGRIDPARVAWISLGVLRFNPEMRRTMEDNFPRSRLTSAQLVAGPDGKVRYIKPLRREMFRHMVDLFRRHWKTPAPFIYLCMESSDMWRYVFGSAPDTVQHLDYLLATSMHERFPHVVRDKPERAHYDAITGLPER